MFVVVAHDGEDKYSNEPWAIGPFDTERDAWNWVEKERLWPVWEEYVRDDDGNLPSEDERPDDIQEWYGAHFNPWDMVHYAVTELKQVRELANA